MYCRLHQRICDLTLRIRLSIWRSDKGHITVGQTYWMGHFVACKSLVVGLSKSSNSAYYNVSQSTFKLIKTLYHSNFSFLLPKQ